MRDEKEKLEIAVHQYQVAKKDNNIDAINDAYLSVLSYYDPEKHKEKWFSKYGKVFDYDRDDFDSVYYECFLKAISSFKTRSILEAEGKSLQGKGDLNNLFIRILSNEFLTIIKKRSAAMRNPDEICPICNKMVAPLSAHLLKHHQDFTWQAVMANGHDESSFEKGCPICPKHLHNRPCKSTSPEVICKHISSAHASIVFEHFETIYPNFDLSNRHTVSFSEIATEDTENIQIEDVCPSIYQDHHKPQEFFENEVMDKFFASDFSETEMKIVNYILSDNVKQLTPEALNLTQEDFELARHRLQEILIDVGATAAAP